MNNAIGILIGIFFLSVDFFGKYEYFKIILSSSHWA